MGKTWTNKQNEELLQYHDQYSGESFFRDAAQKFGRSYGAIEQQIRKLQNEQNAGKDLGRRDELSDEDLETLDRIENAVTDSIREITGTEPELDLIHDVIETLEGRLRELGYDTNVPYREEEI